DRACVFSPVAGGSNIADCDSLAYRVLPEGTKPGSRGSRALRHDRPERGFQCGIAELITGLQQPFRNDPAALQDELGLGANRDRAEFEHPAHDGQSEWHAKHATQRRHHGAIVGGIRRGGVDDAVELSMTPEELDDVEDICDVDPAELLPTAARSELVKGSRRSSRSRGDPVPVVLRSTESELREPDEWDESTSVAEHYGHAQGDATRAGKFWCEELALPGRGDVD